MLVAPGGERVTVFEVTLKMALIGKPKLLRHVHDGMSLLEQLLAPIDALVELKGMRCLAIGLLEAADQMIRTQIPTPQPVRPA